MAKDRVGPTSDIVTRLKNMAQEYEQSYGRVPLVLLMLEAAGCIEQLRHEVAVERVRVRNV